MALLIRDAKIIQKLDDGNLHDVPSMVLLREIVASFESMLAEEKAERIAADNELRDMILKEIADRITGDNNLVAKSIRPPMVPAYGKIEWKIINLKPKEYETTDDYIMFIF